MSEISLKSDESIVSNHKNKLTDFANEMKNTSSVGPGSTNHGVNSTCSSLYESTKMLFQNYSGVSILDIGNIKKIDNKLHEADIEMSGEM